LHPVTNVHIFQFAAGPKNVVTRKCPPTLPHRSCRSYLSFPRARVCAHPGMSLFMVQYLWFMVDGLPRASRYVVVYEVYTFTQASPPAKKRQHSTGEPGERGRVNILHKQPRLWRSYLWFMVDGLPRASKSVVVYEILVLFSN
jgi:hypothetical protein